MHRVFQKERFSRFLPSTYAGNVSLAAVSRGDACQSGKMVTLLNSYWLLVLQTELASGLYLLCHWGSCCDARAASPGAHIRPLFIRVCIDHYVYAAHLPVDGVCEPACV